VLRCASTAIEEEWPAMAGDVAVGPVPLERVIGDFQNGP